MDEFFQRDFIKNYEQQEIVKLAYDFASEKHSGQYRADGCTPYIVHPIRVAEIVRQFKRSNRIHEIMAAAYLHDTLEDTYTSYRELEETFGEVIASMVMEVSSASYMPKLVGKGDYLKHKMKDMSNYALVIKLADRLDNLRDSKSLPESRQNRLINDTIEILMYLEENRELTKTQKNLIAEIRRTVREIYPISKAFSKTHKNNIS